MPDVAGAGPGMYSEITCFTKTVKREYGVERIDRQVNPKGPDLYRGSIPLYSTNSCGDVRVTV